MIWSILILVASSSLVLYGLLKWESYVNRPENWIEGKLDGVHDARLNTVDEVIQFKCKETCDEDCWCNAPKAYHHLFEKTDR